MGRDGEAFGVGCVVVRTYVGRWVGACVGVWVLVGASWVDNGSTTCGRIVSDRLLDCTRPIQSVRPHTATRLLDRRAGLSNLCGVSPRVGCWTFRARHV